MEKPHAFMMSVSGPSRRQAHSGGPEGMLNLPQPSDKK